MAVPPIKNELTVKSDTIAGTVYSQVVGITVTDTDLTLEFIYVNPRTKIEGEVVARVTLPIEAAQGLSKTITDTMMQHFNKKEKTQ